MRGESRQGECEASRGEMNTGVALERRERAARRGLAAQRVAVMVPKALLPAPGHRAVRRPEGTRDHRLRAVLRSDCGLRDWSEQHHCSWLRILRLLVFVLFRYTKLI